MREIPYSPSERREIFDRCIASANDVKLTKTDIRRIINLFEYSGMDASKVGNIIKFICVLIQYKDK